MMKAKTIMTENVVAINENVTVAEAAKTILNKRVSSMLVTKNSYPVAIVTMKDLINGIVNISPKVKVKDVMTKELLVINPDTNYSYIVEKLKKEKIKRFPIVENNKLIGIITETDIIDATRDFTRLYQIMQEVILAIFGLVTAFFLFFFSPLGQIVSNALS